MKTNKPKKDLNAYVKYSGLALQMGVIIGVGMFGGVQLDKLTSWQFPLFTLILSLASVALAIYIAIKDFIKK
ncbi:MAG: AtpZ/AtpI family protein [Bacteroidales bacterium]|nr:AtpZ/AtpI family protein [Bacteroidales bacterium]